MKRLTLLFVLLPALAGATDITIAGNVYTLSAHPRVFLDGPAGTITTRLKDPDAGGAGVSAQADDANPAFVALKNQVRACRASPTYCSGMSERSTTVLILALDWYMDNSQTDSLAAAIYWLNNVETWVASFAGFGCDITNAFCGTSSWSDWPSVDMGVLAQAYSIIRSEMSAGERTAFAQKFFNDDVAGYQDNCTNQLQQEVGATATYTSGSAAVTGTNLDGLTDGRVVYIKTAGSGAGGWATIQTVNSAASITLTGAPQFALGGNAGSVTSGQIHELKPWDSSTCGFAWMLQHHSYNPPALGLTGYVAQNTSVQYTINATSITVYDTTGLPAPPFYARASTGEIMKVTAVNGLTLSVDRAQLGTNAAAGQYPPRPFIHARYLPNDGTADYANNLIIQKIYGYLLAGIALADDSARAVSYAGWAADVWLTSVYPLNRAMFTGFQQGGSTNYGPGRQLSHNFSIVAALKNIPAGGSPSLDKSGGTWLTQFTNGYLYTGIPGFANRTIPWGQPDIASPSDYHAQMWAPFQTYLLGSSSDAAKYWQHFQRTVAGLYTSANLTAAAGERMIPWALMFWQEADATADYMAALPTQQAFNVVDGDATHALNSWVSRTGWTSSSDSLVYLNAFNINYTQDHIGTGEPGAYKVYKNGWVLSENGATDKDTGAGGNSNLPQFGGLANLKSAAQNQRADIDKVDAGTGWAFTRTNLGNAYTATAGATRALRYLIHFKKAASPDYLVHFDDLATSSAKTIGFNLFYDKTAGESSNITTVFPDVVWTGPNRRVSTKIVLPSGTGVARTYNALTNSHQVYTYASTDGTTAAAVTSSEFLLVHRPSTSTSDTMPTVAALGTIDSDYVGVQIEGEAPSVAVFPKAGAYQTSTSFTTTHEGTAQYVVTGMETGIYDVVRGVTTIVDDETIAADGTIAFESVAGAFTLTRAGEVPAIAITTTTLSNAVQHAPYSAQLEYEGGTPPVEWTKTVGDLPTGLTLSAAGLISGEATGVDPETFTVQVEDDNAQTDTQGLTLTVVAPSPTLSVVATPGSTSVTVQFGTAALPEEQSCDVVVSSSAISGEGYVEFTATEANTYRMFGLSNGNTDATYQDIDYGIHPRSDGSLWVFEAGVMKYDESTYQAGDTLRVGIVGGVVRYYKNGVAFYSSEQAPTYPLIVDAALYNLGATITDAVISNGGDPVDVVWASDVGVTVTGNTLTKTASTAWGNAGAISTAQVDPGQGIGPVAQTTSSSGPSTRSVSLSGLLPNTDHTATVTCGTVASGQDSFTTTEAASGSTVAWTYKLRPATRLTARGVTNALVSYNVVGEAADTLSSGCIPDCTFLLPLLSGQTYELQHAWRSLSAEVWTEDVVWTDAVGVTVDGNSLTKAAAGGLWDAGAISTQQIDSGDGYVEFTASETDTYRMIGLSHGNADVIYQDVDFAVYLRGDIPNLRVYEDGFNILEAGAYETGDVFRVAVVGGVVKYSKNGVVFYTSTKTPTYPLLVDSSFQTQGGTVDDVIISGDQIATTLATSRKGTVAVP